MTQIKKVKTSEGVQFYPQTHTKAVIDDNGYTAESRLGAMQDEINQAQLKVGAVPSDLTPTEDSTNWVTSGGLYNKFAGLVPDSTLSISNVPAESKRVGDILITRIPVIYDNNDVVWARISINNATGIEESSYSLVGTETYIPILPSVHIFTPGNKDKYQLYFYDKDKNYLGTLDAMTSETEVYDQMRYMRIVAGDGSPYLNPNSMIGDEWTLQTEKEVTLSEKVAPLEGLPARVGSLEEDGDYENVLELEEITRLDYYRLNASTPPVVSAVTSPQSLVLCHIPAGEYLVTKTDYSFYVGTLLCESSSSTEIVPTGSAIVSTSLADGTYKMTFTDGYYIMAYSMKTGEYAFSFKYSSKTSKSELKEELTTAQSYIDNTKKFLGDSTVRKYGNYFATGSAYEGGVGRKITVNMSASEIDGIVSRVTLGASADGKIRIFVGALDQRNSVININGRYLDVDVEAGTHTYNIWNKGLVINKGEQLFAYIGYYNGTTLNYTYHQNFWTAEQNRILLSPKTGDMDLFTVETHTDIPFNWEIVSSDSVFAFKSEIEEMKKTIESQSEQINRSGIIFDTNGVPYMLSINNGVIVPKTVRFKKVVALGNSLTDHPYNTTINWLTHGYSMAATCRETSWTYQFERILKKYNADAEVTAFNIYKWEANPLINPASITSEDTVAEHKRNLANVLTTDVDCVIFRAGENGNPSESNLETGLKNLLQYVIQKCPNATILVCNMFWHVKEKEKVFQSVASSMGLKYIDTGYVGYRQEIQGGFCWNYDKTEQFMIRSAAVAKHTSDEGFYLFANKLASSLGMEELSNELHNVNVVSTVNYKIKSKFGVTGGLISIVTSAQQTVVVTSESGSNIEVTIHDITEDNIIADDFVATFTMPDEDVNVEIS